MGRGAAHYRDRIAMYRWPASRGRALLSVGRWAIAAMQRAQTRVIPIEMEQRTVRHFHEVEQQKANAPDRN